MTFDRLKNIKLEPPKHVPDPRKPGGRRFLMRWAVIAGIAGAIVLALLIALTLLVISARIPPVDELRGYRPIMPLRIYTADNKLLGEFGEERRSLVPFNQIPDILKKAVLAIEDDRFYQHGGVDYLGIARAAIFNIISSGRQGASTITQQVARNFFLTSEQTFKRKLYEVMLAWRIEEALTKDEIFELYLNQIYLGQRAYGFASAAQIYFGKNLNQLTIAEAAMLAGLPKAPSANNPITNPVRAKQRQQYILLRMKNLGYITDAQYEQAKNEVIVVKKSKTDFNVPAPHLAEMIRQMLYDQYGDAIYTQGINVYTTISSKDQIAAYNAIRQGAIDFEKRHGYRGPEGHVQLSSGDNKNIIADALDKYPASDGIYAAVVTQASPSSVTAVTSRHETVTVTGGGLAFVSGALSGKAEKKITRGSIIRVRQTSNGWEIIQMPKVEGALVSINPNDGAIKALVGGFDFARNQFNHATQSWRQPGSSFKPFVYSAALEKGFAPSSIINDSPSSFAGGMRGTAWVPKNYDSKYAGPITMRQGLMKSKNLISIHILNNIGAKYAQEHIQRFGFMPEKHPAYLTLALGAGSVTPIQMASAYCIFANGGYRVTPYVITQVTDGKNRVLMRADAKPAASPENRVIDARNAYVMTSLMRSVVTGGTAARASSLGRGDIAGKTGTTNDYHDAWFAGYNANRAAVVWFGYDTPKNMGRETGTSLALPAWISYMSHVLPELPAVSQPFPPGLTTVGDELYYTEYPPGHIRTNIAVGRAESEHDEDDLPDNPPAPQQAPAQAAPGAAPIEERKI